MSLSTAGYPADAFVQLKSLAKSAKTTAQAALTFLQTNSIPTGYVFNLLDQMRGFIALLNSYGAITGLDAYATSQGYSGTLSADVTTVKNNTQACIDWVVQNFPKDTSQTYLLAYILNADGTRTERTFTTGQTAGLQTALTTLINSIG